MALRMLATWLVSSSFRGARLKVYIGLAAKSLRLCNGEVCKLL